MNSRLLFIVKIASFFLFSLLLVGCPDPNDANSSPNGIIWTGAWENGSDFYGTFSFNIVFEGENMLYNGGNGTISGSVSWKGLNGQDLVSETISGTWSNGLSNNHDRLEFSISSTDGHLTIDDYIHYETAAEITDNTFSIGSFSLDSNSGSWYTKVASDSTGIPDVTSAVLIDQMGEFLDIVYIDGKIYATVFEDPDYKIVSINISDGSVTVVAGITCSEPVAIAYDGVNCWVVGKENAGDTDLSLFKYSGVNLNTNAAGYPLEHEDLSRADAISYSGVKLYYHNGSVLMPQIGSINILTAALTAELNEGWDTLPDTTRTTKIASIGEDFFTIYYAAGGEWSSVRKLNSQGELISSFYCPVNGTGPISINGDKLYIIERDPNRLYTIQL